MSGSICEINNQTYECFNNGECERASNMPGNLNATCKCLIGFSGNQCENGLGWHILWCFFETLVLLYIFQTVAILLDEYLVPAIDKICLALKLPTEVAGATLVAIGSALPDILATTIGVATGNEDLGLGGVVGSALIAFTLIPGICGVMGGSQVIELSLRPILRDSICFLGSLAMLIAFSANGHINQYEGIALSGGYVVYLIVVLVPAAVAAKCAGEENETSSLIETDADSAKASYGTAPLSPVREDTEEPATPRDTPARQISFPAKTSPATAKDSPTDVLDSQSKRTKTASFKIGPADKAPHASSYLRSHEGVWTSATKRERERNGRPLVMGYHSSKSDWDRAKTWDVGAANARVVTARSWGQLYRWEKEQKTADLRHTSGDPEAEVSDPAWIQFVNVVWWPPTMLFRYTLPNEHACGEKAGKYFVLTFFLSFIFLSAIAYLGFIVTEDFVKNLFIDEVLGGETLIAFGTSVPDILGSVFLAKNGYADAALSNAVGAQIVSVCAGVGLPAMVFGFVTTAIQGETQGIEMSIGRFVSGLALLVVCVLFYLVVFMGVATCRFKRPSMDRVGGFLVMGSFLLAYTLVVLDYFFDLFNVS